VKGGRRFPQKFPKNANVRQLLNQLDTAVEALSRNGGPAVQCLWHLQKDARH
jgi:hypothetical protein